MIFTDSGPFVSRSGLINGSYIFKTYLVNGICIRVSILNHHLLLIAREQLWFLCMQEACTLVSIVGNVSSFQSTNEV